MSRMNHSIYRHLLICTLLGISGCTVQNHASGEWRQNRSSQLDTFYPGVKYGMSPEEVRAKVPDSYRIETSGNFMKLSRKRPDGSIEQIKFHFEGGRLIDSSDSVSN